MNLTKKNIHMNRCKCRQSFQFTLDSDCNVTDSKPDIEELVYTSGEIRLNEQKLMNDKIHLRGILIYCVLYFGDGESGLQSIQGELPFDEIVNMEGCTGNEIISISRTIDDMTGTMIHSRKINVKALISMELMAEELYDEEAAVEIAESEEARVLTKKITITGMAVDKRDTFRIRESISVPTDKPDIEEIIFKDISLRNIDTRMMEDKITLKGEMNIFFVYLGANDPNMPIYIEKEVPINVTIECSGCTDIMIPCIQVEALGVTLEVKPDEDGEERIAELEAVYDIRIRAYEEEEPEIIQDLYSPRKCITPIYREAAYENLMIRNSTKVWISDRAGIPEDYPGIMSICHVGGEIKVDNSYIIESRNGDNEGTGIMTEGIVAVSIFYMSEVDEKPLRVFSLSIPFSKLISVEKIKDDACYNLWSGIDQINVIIPDGREVEVKAGISLNSVVFEKVRENFIVDIDEQDFDKRTLRNMPSMTGYFVKAGDTLWDIAKRFNTTVDSLKEVNELETDQIKEGDQILVVKEIGVL